MKQQSTENIHSPSGAVQKGIIEGLCGLLFSILLSAVIVTGLYFSLSPFKSIERAGTDLSFRMLTKYADAKPLHKKDPSFLYIDVDRKTCEAFAPASDFGVRLSPSEYCETRNPIAADFISAFVESAAEKPIDIIIIDRTIDLSVPQDAQLVDKLIAISRNPGAPWIILPIEVRPYIEDDGKKAQAVYRNVNPQWFDPEWRDQHRLIDSKVRFALYSISTDTVAKDSYVRSYEPVLSVSTGRDIVAFPTASYLAAQLLKDHSRMDCLYFGGPCPEKATIPQWAEDMPSTDDPPRRILYTLPALSLLESNTDDQHRIQKLGQRYRHWKSDDMFNEGKLGYHISEAPAGLIVVVGTSLASAKDIHVTPVGHMSGPEIIINTIRSQTSFPAPTRTTTQFQKISKYWSNFLEKTKSALLPALVMMAAYIVVNLVNFYACLYLPVWKRFSFLRFLFSTSILSTALWLCFYIEFSGAVGSLYEGLEKGKVVDTLTPIAALGIELYTDIARKIAKFVERFIEWAFVKSESVFKFLGRLIVRN